MIQKIRRRFIRIALSVLACAMVAVTLIINAANLVNVRTEIFETLDYLADNGGNVSLGMGAKGGQGWRSRRMRNALSESRYFTALISPNGKMTLNEARRDEDSSPDEADEMVDQVISSKTTSGFCGIYAYLVKQISGGSRIAVFLNAESKLASLKTLALISSAACLSGIALAWLLVSLFSRRAIRPLIQSAIQQKQFITDAGHELKTPLTVIGANMDVLSLDLGKNEWVESTRKQTSKMSELVNQLVYLSRMDEEDAKLSKNSFDAAAAARDTAQPFIAMAEFSGKSFEIDTRENLSVMGDEAALRRLITILCDNAVKYAPEGDHIILRCRAAGKKLVIETENGAREQLTDENIKHLFDRFYRADSSRSKESVGGTGLGLAIARAIAEKHAGDVAAQKTREGRLLISCRIPLS